MSPSVQCLSVRMPRCSFQPILTGTNHLPCYASLQAGIWGQFLLELIYSIPIWLGCHLASYVILCCIFSTFVITLQLYLIIYQSMTTIVSLLLFIILVLSIIVMYSVFTSLPTSGL